MGIAALHAISCCVRVVLLEVRLSGFNGSGVRSCLFLFLLVVCVGATTELELVRSWVLSYLFLMFGISLVFVWL